MIICVCWSIHSFVTLILISQKYKSDFHEIWHSQMLSVFAKCRYELLRGEYQCSVSFVFCITHPPR